MQTYRSSDCLRNEYSFATHSRSTTERLHTMPTPEDSPHSCQTSTTLTLTARANATMGSANGASARQE
eukprot:8100841-Lingulodinium_polyedra.AAC.1